MKMNAVHRVNTENQCLYQKIENVFFLPFMVHFFAVLLLSLAFFCFSLSLSLSLSLFSLSLSLSLFSFSLFVFFLVFTRASTAQP